MTDFFNMLKIGDKLESEIGATTLVEEELEAQIFKMARKGEEFEATIDKVAIGKTEGGAILRAHIDRQRNIFNVVISGRPLAMDDEKFKTIINFIFDYKNPIFGEDSPDGHYRNNANEILKILKILKPVTDVTFD